jgi:putative NIF3 family GTP cyclohydrolase 1 type 2
MTTIQQVIDIITETVPGAPMPDSVDTFKCGDPSRPVAGILTTFMATSQVIRQAVNLGANLIITHEPTFFNHRDETDWLREDSVYQGKRALLDQNDITIWRFHDYWHMHRPDGIGTGFVKQMGWEAYVDDENGYLADLPPMPLADLVTFLKSKLGMSTLRVVGPQAMTCRRVAMVLGATPGDWQIKAFQEGKADTVICGETTEWQTCEYVRDAVAGGEDKALLVLGHEKSEESGMAYLVEWLQPRVPGVTITHVPAGDPLRFV